MDELEEPLGLPDEASTKASTCFGNDFQLHIRPMIDLIDKLRWMGVDKDVSLPSIVVVGDQSSGKSSVLEALSGVQLPRGSGIVTRCPLELRMRSAQGKWSGQIEYQRNVDGVEELCDEDKSLDNEEDRQDYDTTEPFMEPISDPTHVEKSVRRAQDILAGPDKRVSNSLIQLQIKSCDVPDLTLIDLPGITRIATNGQQEDACEIIKETIQFYIEQEQTIILAVIPANADIATSEALQMAKKVDPLFKRTIGVVTKPDLVDRGGEEQLIQVITNETYHLTLGYTLVKCRSQNAINTSKTLAESLRDEAEFFSSHKYFKDVPEKLLGVKNLSRKLTEVLVSHIKEHLPGLKTKISDLIDSTHTEIHHLGDGLPTDQIELRRHLLRVLQVFSERIGGVAKGDVTFNGQNHPDLNPHLVLRSMFNTYATDINQKIPAKYDPAFIKKLQRAMKERRGNELPRFMSFQVCHDQIKELVTQFRQPARHCLNDACKRLELIYSKVVDLALGKYHDLAENIKENISEQLRETKAVCEDELMKYFEMEAMVYTQDKTYIVAHDQVEQENIALRESVAMAAAQRAQSVKAPAFGGMYSPAQTSSSKQPTPVFVFGRGDAILDDHLTEDAYIMFDKIISYLHVSMQRVADVVPMTILYFMVNRLVEKIRDNVWKLTDQQEDAVRLLSESPDISERRTAARRKLDRLMLAYDEIKKSGHSRLE